MTGVQRFATELCVRLQSLRSDIVFLAPQSVREANHHGLPVEFIGKGEGMYWEQVELVRYLRRQGNPLLLNLCNRAPLSYGQNILVLHDITFIRYPQSYSLPFRLFYQTTVPWLIKRSRKVITVSEFSRAEIARHYHCREADIGVIYNATDARLFHPAAQAHETPPFFLVVASDFYHKNLQKLFDVFQQAEGVQLKVIGNKGKIVAHYERQHPANIDFLGRVTDAELVELYQRAQGFIFPSLYEGFGIPPLEAQACGCPVLAADIPVMREILADSAAYFQPTSERSLLAAIEQLRGNDAQRAQLIQAGLANVQRFSWDKSAGQLSAMLDTLLPR